MAKTREYVKLWFNYDAYFESYTDAEVGSLVRAMIAYRRDGKQPKFDGNERFIWPAIKRDIDESIAAQERAAAASRENGKKGGRPRKTPAAAEEEPQVENAEKTKPNETQENLENQIGFFEDVKNAPQEDKPQKKEVKPAKKENPDFDRLWEVYPKKVGKVAARKAFAKISVPVEKLIDAVNVQKNSRSWTKDDGDFIPNLSTWLNGERWEDKLKPAKNEEKKQKSEGFVYEYRGIEDSL